MKALATTSLDLLVLLALSSKLILDIKRLGKSFNHYRLILINSDKISSLVVITLELA